MSSITNSSYNWKQSYIMRSKKFRKDFHFGGNRRDPLNLNELIQKKKQSTINNNNIPINDRPVEILLPPNIFDPLCLDRNEASISSDTQRHFQSTKHHWFYDQHVPKH